MDIGGVRRRGGNIYVHFSLFVLLYNTKFIIYKFNLMFTVFINFKTKRTKLTVHINYNLQNHPTFHSN